MNIVFMGTPEFAVPTLEYLDKEDYNIKLVVTQPDKPKGRGKKLASPPVKDRALDMGLEVFQPQNVNSQESLEKIKSMAPDFIVVVAYGQILKEKILNAPRFGCINVHASLLPKYRGAAPINWAVINGEKESGITTMLMNKGLDTGDILLMKKVKIDTEETAGELHDKLMIEGAELLIKTLSEMKAGRISQIPQDHDRATYAPMLDKNTGRINWDEEATKIKDLVRGTNPWPVANTIYQDKGVKIFKVDICKVFKDGDPGTVVKVDMEGIYVNTKDNCIIIRELQFPHKRRMTVKEFLVGNEFDIGTRLG